MNLPALIKNVLRPVLGWNRREALRRFFGGKQEMCWVRKVGVDATRGLVESLPLGELSALEISGTTWREWPFRKYVSANYPEYDVCKDVLPERFDLIICEQVFEHLLRPYQAGKNVYEMLKPGGYFMVSVPFLVPIHNHPTDCTRWTEMGLKHFLAECGFSLEGIQTGSWGNRNCVKRNLNEFLYYRENLHPLKNEARFPVDVWALARK
jgi:hypothetical protein